MATRYSEGLLAIKYRVENKDGNMSGGPMFVLERGMKCKWLGVAFAVFTAIAAFGIGNLTQGNAAAEQLHHAFSIPSWGTAIVLTVLTAMVMLGGIRSIARVWVPVHSGRSGGLRPSGHPVHSGLRLHGGSRRRGRGGSGRHDGHEDRRSPRSFLQ